MDKQTLIIEPNAQGELLAFIDTLARITSGGFEISKTKKISAKEILKKIPELNSYLFKMDILEWCVRKVVSPKRIIFDFYFANEGTACFIVLLSNNKIIYTTKDFNMYFPM